MWNGKNKALTFSYDDGVESDRKLVSIFNKYGMKCTFNLNSALMTPESTWEMNGFTVRRMPPEGLPELYKGHEIAVHCTTHADLTKLSDEEVRREVLEDKSALEKLFGTQITGMAYPYGAYDDRIIGILRECGIKFSRTCEDSHDFKVPENLLAFGATCRHESDDLFELLDKFLAYSGAEPAVFCLWGHSYEFDAHDNWRIIEEFCKKAAFREDIFYGTNSQIYKLSELSQLDRISR